MYTRTLRSGRVVSNNVCRVTTKVRAGKKKESSNIESPQQPSSTINESRSLNNAHHPDLRPPSTTSSSSKLAARASSVADIEDLVGGQCGTWGDSTSSGSIHYDPAMGMVKIKQEPGVWDNVQGLNFNPGLGMATVKQEPGVLYNEEFNYDHPGMGMMSMTQEPGLCTWGSVGGFNFDPTAGLMNNIKQEPGSVWGSNCLHHDPGLYPGVVRIKQEPGI